MFNSIGWLATFAAVLMLSSGCAPGPGPEPEPEPEAEPVAEDPAAAREAVDAVREREVAGFAGEDVDALMEVYSRDATIMAPDMPTVSGAEDIRAALGTLMEQFEMNTDYTSSDIHVGSDWAIEHFTANLTFAPKSGEEATTQHVRGLHVYERQGDGSWRIRYDVWNVDPGPAEQ